MLPYMCIYFDLHLIPKELVNVWNTSSFCGIKSIIKSRQPVIPSLLFFVSCIFYIIAIEISGERWQNIYFLKRNSLAKGFCLYIFMVKIKQLSKRYIHYKVQQIIQDRYVLTVFLNFKASRYSIIKYITSKS